MKSIKRAQWKVILFLMVLVASAVFAKNSHAVLYTGNLTANGGGLTATNEWDNSNTKLTWTVESIGVQDGYILWEYTYNFHVPAKDISHMIVEVSTGATQAEFSAGLLDYYSAATQGSSNPGMPGGMDGLKFGPDGLDFTVSFTTLRAPVWGDFYAKDGNAGPVYAYNTTFLNSDPTDDPTNGTIGGKILRPDTKQTPIPEPSSLLLMGAGLLGLIAWRRLRRG